MMYLNLQLTAPNKQVLGVAIDKASHWQCANPVGKSLVSFVAVVGSVTCI